MLKQITCILSRAKLNARRNIILDLGDFIIPLLEEQFVVQHVSQMSGIDLSLFYGKKVAVRKDCIANYAIMNGVALG